MEKEHFLPKGSIVKHGTSLCRVEEILKDGIKCGADREYLRVENELKPEIEGVYIGNLIAYFGAYAAYSSVMQPIWNMPEYLINLNEVFVNPKRLVLCDLPEVPITLPVVLNIQIQKDCLIYADEDFVFDGTVPPEERIPQEILVSEAKNVWLKWQTGCIPGKNGIPAEWIKTIEFPRLGSVESNRILHKDTWADCELFAGGIMQTFLKKEPEVLLSSYKKRYGRECLSQIVPATINGFNAIKSLKSLSTNHNRYFNHAHINLAFEKMAKEYGIQLHR